MQTETIGISIGLAVAGIKELNQINKSFEEISKSIKNTTGSIKGFEKQLDRIKNIDIKLDKVSIKKDAIKNELFDAVSLLSRSVAITIPIKVAMDFESSMADVRKVVDFNSQDELNKFGAEIKKLSRTIPLSINELATITAAGGQMGIAKENLLDFTRIASTMATAFDMSADEAGDSMGKLMNIFNTDIKGVTKLGDAINHLSDNSAAKAGEVVEVLKRIGGASQTVG
ncbi:MAG: phage tail tape measure protein, partial [Campylobacter sp.]|nr:phage tail tape measure protein [Campylobacter sp.]